MAEDFERDCWTLGRKTMAELTKEQIERAAEALWNITLEQRESRQPGRTEDRWCNVDPQFKDEWREWARVAAPFLQLPWDEPTAHEVNELMALFFPFAMRPSHQEISRLICGFIQRRNAALLPKPVDPRCCERDTDGDGNCPIHQGKGVFRNPEFQPVDPRREKILSALQAAYPRLNGAPWSAPFIADVVLEALGPESEFRFGFTGFKELPVDKASPYLDSMLYPEGKMPQPREPFKPNPLDEVK
jgi:hypothetical protein